MVAVGAILTASLLAEGNSEKPGPIDYIAFQPGERLDFDLHYGAIPAGKASMEVAKDMEMIAKKPHYHLKITGRSIAAFDPVYKVRDNYESFIDANTLLPTVFFRNISEGNYRVNESYLFNRATNKIKIGDKIYAPKDVMFDIVSAFYYLRCIDFSKQKAGTHFPVKVWFGAEPLDLGVTYDGVTTIKTKLGSMRVMKFSPVLAKGRIFDGQHDMTLYVSADKNQIPVRIESYVYLGTVAADLIKYSGLKFPLTALIGSK